MKAYGGMFSLKVVDYEVIGELEDGVFEPGEKISIQNIVVLNCGPMPSPKHTSIVVSLSEKHDWFHSSSSLQLQREILSGERVKLDGRLRALISKERITRRPGEKLHYKAVPVQLRATLERHNEPIIAFHSDIATVKTIDIRYPLELEAPRYLKGVVKGEIYRVRWQVRNVSRKPYGLNNVPSRSIHIRLSDPGRALQHQKGEETFFDDMFPSLIQPGQVLDIEKQITISDRCLESTKTALHLELFLASPNQQVAQLGSPWSIITHELPLRISDRYTHNPLSTYLLITNCDTKGSSVRQITEYIRHVLYLEVDVFNVSITGSMDDPITKTSILNLYEGKSVLLYANSFSYFDLQQRTIYDLLDPWEVARLAKLGTSFVFLGNKDETALRKWSRTLLLPAPPSAFMSSVDAANFNGFVTELSLGRRRVLGPERRHLYHQYSSTLPYFTFRETLEQSLVKNSKRDALQLNKLYPLRRFIVSPHFGLGVRGKTGTMTVFEGLPSTAKVLSSASVREGAELSDHRAYMVVSALPLERQVSLFWNFAGDWAFLPYGAIHNTNPHLCGSGSSRFPDDLSSRKVIEYLRLSLAIKIVSEIEDFCAVSLTTTIHASTILSHLPHLSALLAIEPPPAFSASIGLQRHAEGLFALVLAVLTPVGFAEQLMNACLFAKSRMRKTQIRIALQRELNSKFTALFGNKAGEVCARLQNMNTMSERIKLRIQTSREPKEEIWNVLKENWLELTLGPWNSAVDLALSRQKAEGGHVPRSLGYSERELKQHRENWERHMQKVDSNAEFARTQLDRFIVGSRAAQAKTV